MKLLNKIITTLYICLLTKNDNLSDQIINKVKNIISTKIPIQISNSLLILRITYYDDYENLKLFRNFEEFGFEYIVPDPENYQKFSQRKNLLKNNILLNNLKSEENSKYFTNNLNRPNNQNLLNKEKYYSKSKQNISDVVRPLTKEKNNFPKINKNISDITKSLKKKEKKNISQNKEKIFLETKKKIPLYIKPLKIEKKYLQNQSINIKKENNIKNLDKSIPNYMKPINREKNNEKIKENFLKSLIKEKKTILTKNSPKNIPHYMKPLKREKINTKIKKRKFNSRILKNIEKESNFIKNQKKIYNDFLNSLIFISKILFINPKIYNKYLFDLGKKKKEVEKIFATNFKIFFYSKNKLENQFLVLRFKISKKYKIEKSIYKGQRIGNCYNDEEIIDRFNKYIYYKEDFENGNLKNNIFSVNIKSFKNFKYDLKVYFKTREVFISFNIIEKENENNIKNKIFLYNKITNLSMSKLMLTKLGNIGFFNNNDNCYHDLKLLKYGGNNFKDFLSTGIHFIKKLIYFDYKRYNSFVIQNIKKIRNKCERFNNEIIMDSLEIGKRNFNLDLDFRIKIGNTNKTGEFSFKAFENNEYINYLVVFSKKSLFLSVDVEDYARENLYYDDCYYRNDSYFTDYNFNEIYFVYFSKKKESYLI